MGEHRTLHIGAVCSCRQPFVALLNPISPPPAALQLLIRLRDCPRVSLCACHLRSKPFGSLSLSPSSCSVQTPEAAAEIEGRARDVLALVSPSLQSPAPLQSHAQELQAARMAQREARDQLTQCKAQVPTTGGGEGVKGVSLCVCVCVCVCHCLPPFPLSVCVRVQPFS